MHTRADKVKNLFLEAMDLPEADRAAYLVTACAGDETLRNEVQELLQSLAEATGFLAEPSAAAEGPGTLIDRYRLVDRIGEGGFGVVFRAEQLEPMRREVALKVIKLGMDTRRVVARFELERQALARMSHPNIAAVYDGGSTPSGRPYFVMELVSGMPITTYCQQQGLGIEERLALLRQVCLAVQHAHHKGLVHRDLKPGNILVGETEEGVPLPKVIDFGIAKAMDPDDGGTAAFTMTHQGQPIGTLEYMAPEQTNGADVDSRADVYSLGVVLYELLTGRRPFERADESGGSVSEVLQRICNETPQRPSVRVTSTAVDLPLPGADKGRWGRRLRGDLDWIVARALAKQPSRRYPTPAALAEDLQRFLEGRPVEAGPPSTAYQVRCFVARHRFAVGAILLLMVSLAGGVVATTMALADARKEAMHKQRTLHAMRRVLLAADPLTRKGPDFTVRQMLDEFASELSTTFGQDPEVARELHLTVGGAYRSLFQLAEAEKHVARGLELTRQLKGPADPELEGALLDWAFVLRDLGRYQAADQVVDEALMISRDSLRAVLVKGDLRRLQGDPAGGERYARHALERLDGAEDTREHRGLRATAYELLGNFASARGNGAEALRHYQDAFQLQVSIRGRNHPLMAPSWINIANAQKSLGEISAAEESAKAALEIQVATIGEEHPSLALTLCMLGDLALSRSQLDIAEGHYQRAHQIRRKALPEGHLDIGSSLSDLARIALGRRQHARAEELYRKALAIRDQANAPEDHARAALLQNLGVALAHQRRHQEAEVHYRAAHALHLRIGGEAQPDVANALQNVAIACAAQGRHEEALTLHRQVLDLRMRYQPTNLEAQLASHSGIARSAEALEDFAAAAAAVMMRAELMERMPEADPQRIAATRSRAGQLWLDAGDPVAATPLIEMAHTYCEEHLSGRWPHGEVLSLLAQCRLASKELDLALELAMDGLQILEQANASEARLVRARRVLQDVRAAMAGNDSKERQR